MGGIPLYLYKKDSGIAEKYQFINGDKVSPFMSF